MKSPRPIEPGYWRALVFGDLHVNARTLTRALETLRRIRLVVATHPCIVVCVGDFWDKRGTLAVRQVDAVLDELEEWRRAGVRAIFVPGNHDQVSLDGKIHGIKIFAPFPNITVATERLLIPEDRLAFLPWRESAQDQAEQFATLEPPGNWTVFGHAEVRGALANNGLPNAAGRVTLPLIHANARACYLGHYHARQQLGDRTFYIGSPFEQNIGERGHAHGLAIVESTSVPPLYVDLHDFPKHHRIDLRTPGQLPPMKPADIVEVCATKEQLRDPAMRGWLQALPALDVRSHVVRSDRVEAPPPIAWTLLDAVRAYVGERDGAAALVSAGEELLHAVTPASGATEPLGTTARILGLTGRDFCALRGRFSLDLDRRGVILLRGPIGVGKTSLTDAISWVLYDVTAPRRAAGDTANLRGDDVIHDDADSTSATLVVETDGERFEITRAKKRGKGSKLSITGGPPRPAGVDDQARVERIVGLPHGLWRACVSLGQGAVANFLSGANKARTALLSDAHGLGVCELAQKEARRRAKEATERSNALDRRRLAAASVLSHIEAQDFAAESSAWETGRQASLAALRLAIADVEAKIVEATRALAARPEVQTAHDELDDTVITLERQLAKSAGSTDQRARLQREMGSADAEIKMAERDLVLLQMEHARLVESVQGGGVSATCPTCSQPWPRAQVDHHLADVEAKIRAKQVDVRTFGVRMSNAAMQLEGLSGVDSSERERIQQELDAARAKMTQTAKALLHFERLSMNKDAAEQHRAAKLLEHDALATQTDPWRAKAQEVTEQARTKRMEIEELDTTLRTLHEDTTALHFWADGFGQKGLPVVVLRTVLGDLEQVANDFLAQLVEGRIWAELTLVDDALDVLFHKYDPVTQAWRERRIDQLSTGERRCAELAFSPFGLSEMLFRRLRCKVPFLVIDELTTHLGQEEKALACEVLRKLDRETVLVIDHDQSVQSEFDVIYDVIPTPKGVTLERTR